MPKLNLPEYEMKLKVEKERNYVLDRLRKRYVKLTPEEYVRQHFVNYLIEYKNYPEGLLANEIEIKLGNVKKRCDTILYDRKLNPIMLIEYKAPFVAVSESTFDQIMRYNMELKVPWVVVSNGLFHFCCRINSADNSYRYEMEIPDYSELCNYQHQ